MGLEMLDSTMKSRLIRVLREQFRLDWRGIHGAPHWARVRRNGLLIAKENGARTDVVECFALLHDSHRIHDDADRRHGARAADYVTRIHEEYLRLDRQGLDMLVHACEFHSDGLMEADITVQTCWDADRLDLGRVGIRPSPRHLCTPLAREASVLDSAYLRSVRTARR
jgi:uncharacterized protein